MSKTPSKSPLASEPMPWTKALRAAHWQRLITVSLLSLLSACDGGYSNLPNVRTHRADTSLINYLPITLKSKDTSITASSGSSKALQKLRKDSLIRLSRTSDAVGRGHQEAHTLTHAFITENAELHEDRAKKIIKTRETLAAIQDVFEEHCTHVSSGEDCKLGADMLDLKVLRTAFGYLPSNEGWQPDEQEVAFLRSANGPLEFKVMLTFKSEVDYFSISLRWNHDRSTLEESLRTRWITAASSRAYNHTFFYDEDQTSSFNASGSINDSSYNISQDLNRKNSDFNEVTLRTLASWNTQIEQGKLTIDITADDNTVRSLSSFDNRVDGGHYASMNENEFDQQGKLTRHRYCIGSADSGCSKRNSWVQTIASTTQ